jgi:hypothetical protein
VTLAGTANASFMTVTFVTVDTLAIQSMLRATLKRCKGRIQK